MDIEKIANCWYVVNTDDSPVFYCFHTSSLNTYSFDDFTAERIVEDIEEMIKECVEDDRVYNPNEKPNNDLIIKL